MTEQEKINGWTFEETVKTAENLMENEQNMFKWDVLRHLRDFTETFKEELEQYRALGTVKQIKTLQDDYWKLNEMCKDYSALGTVEELRVARDKQVAVKPRGIDRDICPNCSTFNSIIPKRRNAVGSDTVYCWHCGTAIECEV